MKPFITCICPTYKRPEFLANIVKCFEMQDYPSHRCELIILDDALQYPPQVGESWTLLNGNRAELNTLSKKFDKLVSFVALGDLIAIWEDDDLYFPHHLEMLSRAFERGGQFITPHRIFSTYGQSEGNLQVEFAAGRFHASWAFTPDLLRSVGGYPNTARLDYDQQLNAALRKNGKHEFSVSEYEFPSYVYRWGNNIYHGSQAGEVGYDELWKKLEALPFEIVPVLKPCLDKESKKLLKKFVPGVDIET